MTTNSDRSAVTVAQFEALLKAYPNKPFKLREVCATIGVEERTFRNSCHEHLGMSPQRYFALRRMQLVRGALLRANLSTTVTRVAFDHGYWELGRFAAKYRALFGELPSITLRRPPVNGLVAPYRSAEFSPLKI
jgi:AraC-like DNA-binding protein